MDRIVVSLGIAVMLMAGSCQAADRPFVVDRSGGLRYNPSLKNFVLPSKALVTSIGKGNSKKAAFKGATQYCQAGSSCSIDVELTESPDPDDASKMVCSLKTSDVEIRKGGATLPIDTTISFRLVINGTPTAGYAFKKPGIVVAREESAGMVPPGNVTVTDTTIDALHKYKAGHGGRRAWYFPLVFQSIGGDITYMCGAGDPKIVNS